MYKYILQGKTPVPCDDLSEWAKIFEGTDRRVAEDKVGDVRISTVFLGIDYSFGDGEPLVFETMVFGSVDEDYPIKRYTTWGAAVVGHSSMLAKVRRNART